MARCNLLLAIPYWNAANQEIVNRHASDIDLLLDSGAFTAWKSNAPIKLDDYCQFLDGMTMKPWRYFALDVIGEPDKTMANFEALRSRGYAPVPIYTRGAPADHLKHYFDNSEIVGLGGLAATFQDPRAYLKHIWSTVHADRVHILGITNVEWIKYFLPYSCDSSSWTAGGRYGTMRVYLGAGRMANVRRKDIKSLSFETLSAIDKMGFDPYALDVEDNWRGQWSMTMLISCLSYTMLSQEIFKTLGVRLFLAGSMVSMTTLIIASYLRYATGYWPDFAVSEVKGLRRRPAA